MRYYQFINKTSNIYDSALWFTVTQYYIFFELLPQIILITKIIKLSKYSKIEYNFSLYITSHFQNRLFSMKISLCREFFCFWSIYRLAFPGTYLARKLRSMWILNAKLWSSKSQGAMMGDRKEKVVYRSCLLTIS